MSIRTLSALVAAVALTAGQAHAFGEAGPLPVANPEHSTISARDVSAQARDAQRAGLLINGEAGQVLAATAPAAAATQRPSASVARAQARSIGASGNGEVGPVGGTASARGNLVTPSDVRAGSLVPTL